MKRDLRTSERERNARILALEVLNRELAKSLREMVRYDDLPEAEKQPAVERARAVLVKAPL